MKPVSVRLLLGLLTTVLALWLILQLARIPEQVDHPSNLYYILRWCSTWRDQAETLACLAEHKIVVIVLP